MFRTALVVPWMVDKYKKIEFNNREVMAIQILGAILKEKGIECDLYNAHALRIANEELSDELSVKDYDFIGISCISQRSYKYAKELINMLRDKSCKSFIVLGGFYISTAFIKIIEDIPRLDCIIVGEGEESLPMMVENLSVGKSIYDIDGVVAYRNGELVINEVKRICDLNKYPAPLRDFNIVSNKYTPVPYFRIFSGRGCYGRCSFCSTLQHIKIRRKIYRRAELVVQEMEDIVKKYNVNLFRFDDDIFYDLTDEGQKWVDDFVDDILYRNLKVKFDIEMRASDVREDILLKLKSAGLYMISIGAESGVDRILQEMRKDITVQRTKDALEVIKKCGIITQITYIALVPTMTFEELKQSYDFLLEVGCYTESNLYNRLNVYNACEYENILREKGLLIEQTNFYERHGYIFADDRVELFATFIGEIRNEFSIINDIITEKSQLRKNTDALMNIIKDVSEKRKEIWIEVIKGLIKDIEENYENNKEEIYNHFSNHKIDVIKRISVIAQYLNAVNV